MSAESTAYYYTTITRKYAETHGDLGYPEIVIFSVSFQVLADLSREGKWPAVAERLVQAAAILERAGADFLVLAANTMHLVADDIRAAVGVPLVSIVEVVASAAAERGWKRVGLIGTRQTLETALYERPLAQRGVGLVTPDRVGREVLDRVIYEELTGGKTLEESRAKVLAIICDLGARGAEGVILGCTELGLLVSQEHTSVPLLDSAALHVEAALREAVE